MPAKPLHERLSGWQLKSCKKTNRLKKVNVLRARMCRCLWFLVHIHTRPLLALAILVAAVRCSPHEAPWPEGEGPGEACSHSPCTYRNATLLQLQQSGPGAADTDWDTGWDLGLEAALSHYDAESIGATKPNCAGKEMRARQPCAV